MTLREAIETADSLDTESTIYATEPWTEDSNIELVQVLDDKEIHRSIEARGLKYFLEIFIVQDFVKEWKSRYGSSTQSDEMCKRLIHYAIHDA